MVGLVIFKNLQVGVYFLT